jgi:hypothetical protein
VKAFPTAVMSSLVVGGAMRARAETDAGIPGGIDLANLHETAARVRYDYPSSTRLAAGARVELSRRGRWAVRLEPMYAASNGSRFLDLAAPASGPRATKQNDRRLSTLEPPGAGGVLPRPGAAPPAGERKG